MKRLKTSIQNQLTCLLHIHTQLTEQERVLLFELAESLLPGSDIVEIGSYLGASTCFLAAGGRSNGSIVYAVDTWTNIGMSEGSRDTFGEFVENTEALRPWIVPLRGLSAEIAGRFDKPIDLLFIDGDHSYEAVFEDLEVWLPKVKDGGVVVFHDYSWAPGVQKAVREFVAPIQTEAGRRLDTLYWTRIGHPGTQQGKVPLLATVVIPTYNRTEYLKSALVSIQEQNFGREQYETLVVDNGPRGEARAVADEMDRNGLHPVRYIREPKVGLHNARHAGARAAHGEIVAYIDDDTIVSPDWLAAILKSFSSPNVAIVGGKVLPKWEKAPPEWLSQFHSSYLSLLDLGETEQELHWPDGVFGCNMAVRRTALYQVGGFNPDAMADRSLIWWRGDGETGLHKKILDAGYSVMYQPQAWVYHRIAASRLTPEYFCWRAFIQGISDSYTHMRTHRLSVIRLLRHGGRCAVNAACAYARSLQCPDGRIQSRVSARYWLGRSQHQIRLALNPALRRYVLQDTYM